MDETRIQCNKEEGKRSSSESFMWVMRSAASEEIQAAFFFTPAAVAEIMPGSCLRISAAI